MKLPVLLFTLILAALARAQDTLSLEQAARLALAGNPAVRAAEARERAAGQGYREAIGYRLPSVTLQEVGVRTTNPAEAFAFQMNQERFSLQEFGNPARDPNNPEPLNTFMTRAEATLPLFTGGMLSGRTKQAHLMLKAARATRERTTDETVFSASEAWLNLARARENLSLMRRSLETAQQHLQQARDYHTEGLIVSSEVLRAEVYVAELEEWLARAENGERLAVAALNFALGTPQSTPQALGSLPGLDTTLKPVEVWLDRADAQRQDLAAARLQVQAAETESNVARAGFLPEIGVVGRYDYYDNKLFGQNGRSWALMGALKWNIFHGGADLAKWQRNRSEAQAHAADADRFREGVALEIRQAHGDLESARLRHEAATAALAAGRENLRVTEERHHEGVVKMTDLLDAQTALRELEVRELNARYDQYLALYRLRLASGTPVLEISLETK